MKLLTITVPCYNSQDYMEHCIDTLLTGGTDVEIIIVDDGSSDRTAEIADDYMRRFPDTVRAIHQENGGHGEAVNTGIANANGVYFKVVDSDDWVDTQAFQRILAVLREAVTGEKTLDMLISNFVYEKEGASRKKVMKYALALPQDCFFTWSDIRAMPKGKYILMHSVIYRTGLLRECGLHLPAHTFYVDNLFVYQPLPYVKTMYYLDVNFYRYYIGRSDQSVNEKVMISRIDQQIYVNELMLMAVDLYALKDRHMRNYMFNYLEIITVVSTMMCLRSGTEENMEKKRALWTFIKDNDLRVFHKLRNGIMGQMLRIPGESGRTISLTAYKVAQKLVGFN